MKLQVLPGSDALQVFNGIIERVAVFVMNFMPFRNRAVRILPDFLMQRANTLLSVDRVGAVIESARPLLRFGVASKSDPLVDNDFNSLRCSPWHDASSECSSTVRIISPYRKACNAVYPCPST
jgi:hypothetical protein